MTLIKYPGSKNLLADRIIDLFPENYDRMTYLEPFFGSGSVFFRKRPSAVETINDIDSDVVNLFKQIREAGDELARLVEYTPWSREEYWLSYKRAESELENARRFMVRCWMSIGAKSSTRTGFRNNIKGENGNIGAFADLPRMIKDVSARLKPKRGNIVQIERQDAMTLIEKYNRSNVLMYLDPPYVMLTRSNNKIYRHEMTDDDHIALCDLLSASKAKIVLSGYENGIYKKHINGFKTVTMKSRDETGREREETVWVNYDIPGSLFQPADLEEIKSA